MDGYSIALSLSALMIGIGSLLYQGYYKRYDFNYKSGQAIGRGLSTFPVAATHKRVIRNCLFLFPFGGLLYLIGWWWAEDFGVKEGKASIGKIPDPKPVKNSDSG